MRSNVLLLLCIILCSTLLSLLQLHTTHIHVHAHALTQQQKYRQQQQQLPSVRTIVNEQGLTTSISDSIQDILTLVQIPDIHGTQSVPLLGDIEYDLTDFAIHQLQVSHIKIRFMEGGLVQMSSEDIRLKMDLNWKYRNVNLPIISGHGTCAVTLASPSKSQRPTMGATLPSNMTLTVQVTQIDEQGRPQFKTRGAAVHLNTLKLDIHGGISGEIVRVLIALFSGTVRRAVETNVAAVLTESIDYTLNAKIKEWDTSMDLDVLGFKFNAAYGLNQVETDAQEHSLIASLNVQFNPIGEPIGDLPFKPVPMPSIALVKPSTGNIHLSDYALNTLFYTLHRTGQLKFLVTPDMIPSTVPIKLDTVNMGRFFPQIAQHYANQNYPMQLVVSTTDTPLMFTSEQIPGTMVQVNLTIGFQVIRTDLSSSAQNNKNSKNMGRVSEEIEHAFTLLLDMRAVVSDVNMQALESGSVWNVTANVRDIQFDATTRDSNIGNIDLTAFKILFNGIVINGIARKYILDLQHGIPVDLNQYAPGLQITSPKMVPGSGFNSLGGEVSWHVPPGMFTPPSMVQWKRRLNHRTQLMTMMMDGARQ